MALSSEILLAWGPRDEGLLAWFEEPPVVRPALEWRNACNALGPLAAKDSGVLDRYERALDGGYEQWIADRDIWRQYGWINFGDWYGESACSWGNNEYDPPYAHYCEFLRGGDPRWFSLGAEAARHLADVDTVNFSTDGAQVGAQYTHLPGHAGGYLPLLSGLRRYHELTGDPRVQDAILGGIDWLLRRTYDVASGHFRYTPCRHRGGGPQPVYTRQVIEGIAYAHALTGRSELRDLVQRGLRDAGDLPPASPEPNHSGFGKDWTSETRYVPSLLAYLTHPPD